MKRLAALLLLLGCSTSSATPQDAGPPCDIEGTYTVHYMPVTDQGSCVLPQLPPDKQAQVTVNGTHVDVTLEGYPGTCPGLVDNCTVNALCSVTNTTTGKSGSLSLTWKFLQKPHGFTGSSAAVVPQNDGTSCTLNLHEEAERK
jgi:hypothetical protein